MALELLVTKTATALFAAALSFTFFVSCAKKDSGLAAGPDFQKKFQEALIAAKPGAVIEVPEGRLDMDRALSLSVRSEEHTSELQST